MAILTRQRVRAYASTKRAHLTEKSAGDLLAEHKQVTASVKEFDVFLSHRYADKTELVGLMMMMEDAGISVFVDWKERPELDRSNVTKQTAFQLKEDMRRCKTLLFAATTNAVGSIWMPWELGLFDGLKGKVATVPLAGAPGEFPGQEYAALYPWVDEAAPKGGDKNVLWVNDTYTQLASWVRGKPCTRLTG